MTLSVTQPPPVYAKAMEGMGILTQSLKGFHKEVTEYRTKDQTLATRSSIPEHYKSILARSQSVLKNVKEAIRETYDADRTYTLQKNVEVTIEKLNESCVEVRDIGPHMNHKIFLKMSLNKAKNQVKKTANSLKQLKDVLEFKSNLEGLQNLLHDRFLKTPLDNNRLLELLDSCHSIINKSLRHLPKENLIQLTSLLHAFKSNIPEIRWEEYVDRLPYYVKDYLRVLKGGRSIDDKIIVIKHNFFGKERWAALAHLVNTEQVPLEELLRSNLLNKMELLNLAPYLRYLDLTGLYDSEDPQFEVNLINRCPCVNFLHILNESISELPPLPFCKYLNCGYCISLTTLPHLPSCQKLKCIGCSELIRILSLPQCLWLDCRDCILLKALPALPRCMWLLSYCCDLDAMPLLPKGAKIGTDLDRNSPISVDIQQLAEDPVSNLIWLGNKYLLRGRPIPEIKYVNEGELSEGIDLGGLTREFISRLFELLFVKAKDGEEPVLPLVDGEVCVWPNFPQEYAEENILLTCYQTVGRMLALCYSSQKKRYQLFTGEIFDPTFFQLIKLPGIVESFLSEDTLIASLLILKGLPENLMQLMGENSPRIEEFDQASLTRVSFLLDSERSLGGPPADFTVLENRKNLRNKVLQEAREDGRIRAASIIASSMREGLTSEKRVQLTRESAENLQKNIQGELNADLLKSRLNWTTGSRSVSEDNLQKTKTFLEMWIELNRDNKEQLRKFVRAVTSNNSLGARKIDVVVYSRGTNNIPSAHTCGLSLELTADYPDQDKFNEKMDLFLLEALAGDGFQFA